MKAYLIDASSQTIRAVDLADGLAGIRSLIGFDSVDSDEVDASGDRLFFDERCFLRDQAGTGRFKLDNLAPVAGKGLVVGSADDGVTLKDAAVEFGVLQTRITWL
jgi:hypothetical protein